MERIYTICMVIGITIPLIALILGGIADLCNGIFHGMDGIFDGLHINLHIEVGNTDICLLPFSIQSICAGLLLFGGIGKLFYNGPNVVAVNIAAGIIGYLVAVVIQTMIRKLRKIEHTTYAKEQLILFDAVVINAILPGQYGRVSIQTYDGISSSYPAKAVDKTVRIDQDVKVKVIRFEKNVAIVEESDIEKKYS